METKLNDYLTQVEKHLKPLPVSERVDILREIESGIRELQNEGRSAEEIVQRLGDPKELARAYLGELLARDGFGWNRVPALCAYYSLASLSGLVVIPTLGICAPVFVLSGVFSALVSVVKLVDGLLPVSIPFADHISFAGLENPFLVFALGVLTGALLCLGGWGCWRLLRVYFKGMGRARQSLLH